MVPAYNEEKTVASVVSQTAQHVDSVIVIDDGSTDGTLEEIKKMSREHPSLEIITWPTNRGKGSAITQGVQRALALGADQIVLIDADGQHDPKDIPNLLLPIERGIADVVLGVRFSQAASRIPLSRVLMNVLAVLAFLLISGSFVSDVLCGFRAYSNRAAKTIFEGLKVGGFEVEEETLYRSVKSGLLIAQIPVSVNYPKNMKVDLMKFSESVLRILRNHWKEVLRRMFLIR